MTIFDLQRNETAIIVNCPIKRLCDLGFIRGEEIYMIKSGSPCIVRLCGQNISIGYGYQKMIEIEGEDNVPVFKTQN